MQGDEELLRLSLAGDEAAFGLLVERYHQRLVGLARGFVGGREAAQDVAQETWIAVLRGADRFEGRSAFRTWLFRICANRARSAAGRERRTTPAGVAEPTVDPRRFTAAGQWASAPDDWAASVDDRIVASELAARAKRAIEELPDLQRQVVTLRDVEGLSSIDVCDVLSLTPANERVLLHRGRSRVRAFLDRERGAG
ncbi:MAG: RNA polymerase sigma factor [Acidimicrobiales bacterium]